MNIQQQQCIQRSNTQQPTVNWSQRWGAEPGILGRMIDVRWWHQTSFSTSTMMPMQPRPPQQQQPFKRPSTAFPLYFSEARLQQVVIGRWGQHVLPRCLQCYNQSDDGKWQGKYWSLQLIRWELSKRWCLSTSHLIYNNKIIVLVLQYRHVLCFNFCKWFIVTPPVDETYPCANTHLMYLFVHAICRSGLCVQFRWHDMPSTSYFFWCSGGNKQAHCPTYCCVFASLPSTFVLFIVVCLPAPLD
jgi:hypothetical protein